MHERIKVAYQQLRMAIQQFNQDWPALVVDGVVWELPLLTEQKTPDQIAVTRHEGRAAIELATDALLAFERDLGQAPGTVVRLPGVFYLQRSVLAEVERINRLKNLVDEAIEETRLELNQVKKARARIMRNALGKMFSTNQLLRSIQAFEGSPRLVVFTWAGHTAGGEHVPVGQIRAELEAKAQLRADREHVAIHDTHEYQELRSLVNMADDECLLKHKPVAPHPRAMFYFSESTRYEAMIHANLPAFVIAGEGARPGDHQVHELRDFDRHARSAQRHDKKSRIEALPGKDLFVPGKTRKESGKSPLEVPATYGKEP